MSRDTRMGPGVTSRWSPQIYQAACDWFVEFRTGDPSEKMRGRFLAWLRESPAHMGAYLEVAALWNQSESIEVKEKWPLELLVEQAKAQPDTVVPLAPVFALEQQEDASTAGAITDSRRNVALSSFLRIAIAASLLLILGSVVTWLYLQRDVYVTGTGEQRLITLADGSTVQLNARSKVRVRFSDRERNVDLIHGQALFEVAKNPRRPFIVASDGTRVRAVGTQFDVYKKNTGVVVTVIEGRVAVSPESVPTPRASGPLDARKQSRDVTGTGPDTRAEVLLSAGEQLTVAPKILRKLDHANIARATGWTQRQLVFESTPLAEVVEEFNRYNERQLVLKDRGLEEFQIDGVFSSTSPAPLIEFLRTRPGIRVIDAGDEIAIEQEDLP